MLAGSLEVLAATAEIGGHAAAAAGFTLISAVLSTVTACGGRSGGLGVGDLLLEGFCLINDGRQPLLGGLLSLFQLLDSRGSGGDLLICGGCFNLSGDVSLPGLKAGDLAAKLFSFLQHLLVALAKYHNFQHSLLNLSKSSCLRRLSRAVRREAISSASRAYALVAS